MEVRYVDAHAHVQFAAYDEDREEVIKRAQDAGVRMLVVGTQRDTSQAAVALAGKYEEMYAAIALHPIHTSKSFHDKQEFGGEGKEFTSRGEIFEPSFYEKLGQSPKVVAVGECGLDYYRLTQETKKTQMEVFRMQIELANKLRKPLMLHIRQAYKDALAMLREHAKVKGNVHFFAGTWEEAKQFLDFGFALSFTGVITFTHDYDEVVRNTPLDMILSETDAPYVSPVPHRGKRNEPSYVIEVVKKIAELKNLPIDEVAAQILLNSERIFALAK